MFTNSKIIGKVFDKEIKRRISDAEHLEIATGYFGYKELEQITPQLLAIAKRGSCKLLFGMIYREKATKNQRECLLKLNKKLKSINASSGIFLTYPLYHGKVYKFVKNEEVTILVGSSNLSGSGLRGNIEFNLEITDTSAKNETISFLDFLFNGEGFKKGVSVPLYEELLTLKKTNEKTKDAKTLKDFEINKNLFPENDFKNSFKIFHRPSETPNSALNLYFGRGRKTTRNGEVIYLTRPWYEVEISADKKDRKHEDYPRGNWDAYVHDEQENKYYKLKMKTVSDDFKASMTSKEGGGRAVLGELIKGRMERMGVLKKYEPITDETLDEYGKNYIELAKIGDKKYLMKV
mgnify:CR=1 FL=1